MRKSSQASFTTLIPTGQRVLQDKVWQDMTLGKSCYTLNDYVLVAGKRVHSYSCIWDPTHDL